MTTFDDDPDKRMQFCELMYERLMANWSCTKSIYFSDGFTLTFTEISTAKCAILCRHKHSHFLKTSHSLENECLGRNIGKLSCSKFHLPEKLWSTIKTNLKTQLFSNKMVLPHIFCGLKEICWMGHTPTFKLVGTVRWNSLLIHRILFLLIFLGIYHIESSYYSTWNRKLTSQNDENLC